MKFRVGAPPNSINDTDFVSGNWKRVNGLPFWLLQLVSFLLGAMAFVATLYLWLRFWPLPLPDFDATWEVPVVMGVVWIVGIMLQLSMHPGWGLSEKSTLGIWPSRFTPYTFFDGAIAKWRCILQLVLPFAILVVLPFPFALFCERFAGWLAFISCLSAFSFAFGPIVALSAAIQLPAHSYVASRGFQWYWRCEQLGSEDLTKT
jgi:hypothetical protein